MQQSQSPKDNQKPSLSTERKNMKEVENLTLDGEELDLTEYAKKKNLESLEKEVVELKKLLTDGNEVAY